MTRRSIFNLIIYVSGKTAGQRRTFSRPWARWQFSDGRASILPWSTPDGQAAGLGMVYEMNHAERQQRRWSGGCGIEDAGRFSGIWVKLLLTQGLGKKGFGMTWAMVNVSGRGGPVRFALKMLEHSVAFGWGWWMKRPGGRIWVKLLILDEALRVIWLEGKSHAEPQRLICSGGEEPCWTSTADLPRRASQWRCLNVFVRFARSFWWMKRCGWCGLRGRDMLNLNRWSGPVAFGMKMLQHFCPNCVKLLMDEALRAKWPERMSHAEPQRLVWSGGLRIEGLSGRTMLNLNRWSGPVGFAVKMPAHFCRIWVKSLLMDEALRGMWPEGKSHAEPQRLIWSDGLRVADAWTFLSDLGETSDGWSAAGDRAWGEEPPWTSTASLVFTLKALYHFFSRHWRWLNHMRSSQV